MFPLFKPFSRGSRNTNENLFRLWVAEGFISQHEVETKKTMEDVAESYMHKLIKRSMVQLGEIGKSGRVKTCRIHDLMLDLCLSEANKESFFKNVVYDGNGKVVSPEVRRLVVYTDQHFEYPIDFELTPKLRPFFLISKVGDGEGPLISRINCFKLLRTLTLNRCRVKEDRKWKEIEFLIHLRYLTIIKCGLTSLPSSIGNLRYLQTLFIKDDLKTVPNVLWKFEQLRHLVLPPLDIQWQKLVQLGNLRNLQTLQGFNTCVFDMNELVKLTNLKKLGIDYCDKEDLRVFEPERLSFNSLSSLSLKMSSQGSVIEETDLERVFTCCHHLCKLYLDGRISKLPKHQRFPPNLTKLTLYNTELKEDPMATLEKLPKLEYLSLKFRVTDAGEIVSSSKGFPQLKTLILFCVGDMLEWRVEEEAMRNLCHLCIYGCYRLKRIPDGLRFITTLRELVIQLMPRKFEKRLQVVNGEGGEDLYKVQHVPSIIFR